MLPGEGDTRGTAKGDSRCSTLLGFSSVWDILLSECSQCVKPRVYQFASPASVGLSSHMIPHCSSKHLQIHLHAQRTLTPGSGHDFTCGLWSEGCGMIGVFMGLLGSTKVPAVVQDRASAKGDAPAPAPRL